MQILACDTSGSSCSVALLLDKELIFEATSQNMRTHSINFMPMVEECFERSASSIKDVDMFACVVGPGSFTGVRIGVAAVKAFASSLHKPCIALSSLEVLASAFPKEIDFVICPIRDARRGQVYCAAFQDGIRLMDDAILIIDAFLETLPQNKGKFLFVGDAVPVYQEHIRSILGDKALFSEDNCIRAYFAGRLAFERKDKATSSNGLEPVYLRAPQAERERLGLS